MNVLSKDFMTKWSVDMKIIVIAGVPDVIESNIPALFFASQLGVYSWPQALCSSNEFIKQNICK
jgi:hypothetical protein